MSIPRNIHSGSPNSERRKSIAKLTRSPFPGSPFSGSPIPSPRRIDSRPNSFSNGAFLKNPMVEADVGSLINSAQVSDEAINKSDDEIDSIEAPDIISGNGDPLLLQQAQKSLPLPPQPGQDHLKVEGADITRDIYKLAESAQRVGVRRSKSSSSINGQHSRRGSTASSLNVPGGFRRNYIQHQHEMGRFQTREPNFLTRNFVEFMIIYGHFAGEDLEDEDDLIACHYKSYKKNEDPERTFLLSSSYNEEEVNVNGTATETKAYFLLLKAFVGTGVLFLPKAFSNGGLLFSSLTLLFFGFISFWCYLILVYAKRASKVAGFGEIGLKLYGKSLQQLILSSIIISQIGFVGAYIIFTSENIRAFYATIFKLDASELNIIWFILVQLVVFLPLSLIRDITKLSLSALLANVFIMIGLITIIYFTGCHWIITNSWNFGPDIEFYFNRNDFSLFIGVAIFAFEGIGLILPIEQSMIHPQRFGKVLFSVIMTISMIFIGIGTLGYLTYGSKIETVIILNLPANNPMIILMQLLYAFAILLSTPLQLFPAIRLLESKLFKKTGKYSCLVKWEKNLFRFAFVIFTAVVAIFGGQNLDKFVSFVGCFACIPLVYMYPPMLHLKSCCNYNQWGLSDQEKRKRQIYAIIDYLLVFIGGIAMIYTTYQILYS